MKGFVLFPVLFFLGAFAEAGVEVFSAERRDRSAELRTIPPKPSKAGVKRVVPNAIYVPDLGSRLSEPQANDPVLQTGSGTFAIPGTTANFEGIGAKGYLPPDTNGEAGLNHYVQIVLFEFAIFTKNGTLVYGPASNNTLWTGFGGPCETTNQGDPIVVYDQLANRWVFTKFANIAGGPHLECVAVSTSEDPTGSYYRYSYPFPVFNDYPKFGVWPDGYYSTHILRNPDWSLVTGRICAFDRSKMLTGAAAAAVCFDVGRTNFGLLPADLDGITPPPAGSPHFSVRLSTNALSLWRVKVNWSNPSSSTISGPVNIPVAAYTRACNSATQLSCIPQPGITQKLAAFSDRLMFRLSYRNFGSHNSLFANHSVQAGTGVSGVRWYEIRNPWGTPVLFQQGTYSPNAIHRWMGSIASDLNGNVGLGYSVSNAQVYPGIRYTGRLVADPKGTLPQGEGTIVNGSGSQSGTIRWGDYSAMTIDPVNDCTFWYTTQYIPQTGTYNWRTRIASFKFPSCGCAVPAGITNNSATDLSQSAFSGVLISWTRDPGNWGDNGTGTRTYDILRNGMVIEAGLSYGTTSYTDKTAVSRQPYTYSVRYNNGCGLRAVTPGAVAGDYFCTGTVQHLQNPGFESGRTMWSSSPTTIVNNTNGTFAPFSGSWKATLNGRGVNNSAYLVQQVTIPAGACSATLSFRLRIATSETTTTSVRDTISIEILNTSGQMVKLLAKYSNLNRSSSYLLRSFNLNPYIGQTIRIRFRGVEDSARKTTFLVDETALNVQQ